MIENAAQAPAGGTGTRWAAQPLIAIITAQSCINFIIRHLAYFVVDLGGDGDGPSNSRQLPFNLPPFTLFDEPTLLHVDDDLAGYLKK